MRYLAGEISFEEQTARVLDLFAPTRRRLTAMEADGVFATYLSEYRASWCAYPDALATLAALSGFRVAVLSKGDRSQQTQKLRACALDSYFSEILTSSEIGWAKPAPEAFISACSRLGVPPERCLYVGDNLETDARGSASAGMISVWLDRGGSGVDAGSGIQVIHGLMDLGKLKLTLR
jgi:putative hydrolase of the HAD superfamily